MKIINFFQRRREFRLTGSFNSASRCHRTFSRCCVFHTHGTNFMTYDQNVYETTLLCEPEERASLPSRGRSHSLVHGPFPPIPKTAAVKGLSYAAIRLFFCSREGSHYQGLMRLGWTTCKIQDKIPSYKGLITYKLPFPL